MFDTGKMAVDRQKLEQLKRVAPQVLAREQVVPVAEELLPLFPAGGLARGSTVVVSSQRSGGARTLGLGLAAEATQRGSWAALVGFSDIGLAAAAELGVALERVAVIDRPDTKQWSTVIAALLGACDLVLTAPPARVKAGELRRLQARGRERGSVLLSIGAASRQKALHGQADLELCVRARSWTGLGVGHGHLEASRAVIEVTGRRGAARPRTLSAWLPGADGRVGIVESARAVPGDTRYAGGDTRYAGEDTRYAGEDTRYAGKDIDELVKLGSPAEPVPAAEPDPSTEEGGANVIVLPQRHVG